MLNTIKQTRRSVLVTANDNGVGLNETNVHNVMRKQYQLFVKHTFDKGNGQ